MIIHLVKASIIASDKSSSCQAVMNKFFTSLNLHNIFLVTLHISYIFIAYIPYVCNYHGDLNKMTGIIDITILLLRYNILQKSII